MTTEQQARDNAPDIAQHPFALVDGEGVLRVAKRYGIHFALTARDEAGITKLAEHHRGLITDRRTP